MKIDGNDIRKNISNNITKFREMRGIIQKELAAQLGTSPSRVSNWEQGANSPNIEILIELCRILDVSINDIYGVYPDSKVSITFNEKNHIAKYRKLDDHGKEVVDTVLQIEYDRVTAADIPYLMAAHESTDKDVNNEMKKDDLDLLTKKDL